MYILRNKTTNIYEQAKLIFGVKKNFFFFAVAHYYPCIKVCNLYTHCKLLWNRLSTLGRGVGGG